MNTFDPKERALEKQRARDEDQRKLDSGEETVEQQRKRNSFFGSFDFSKWKIVERRKKFK